MRRIALLTALFVLVGARARADDAPAPIVPGTTLPASSVVPMSMTPVDVGAFPRSDRLMLGLNFFAWSAATSLATTAWIVGDTPPSESRLQGLALASPLVSIYVPVFVGTIADSGCGEGEGTAIGRWSSAGGLGSVVFGVSWLTRALVSGLLARSDAAWPAYAGALAGSAVEALGVAWLASY